MKSLFMLIPILGFLVCCTTQKSAQQGSSTAAQRFNLPHSSGDGMATDTVAITGAQFIPILGKSEEGTRPALEGSWQLQSLNGKTITESVLNTPPPAKKPAPGTELRHDSVTTTEKIKGVTYTKTTVQVDRTPETENRITPPQGSVFHIPQRPSINFYGSNETFSGFTGCNRFSGRYMLSDSSSINLKSANASTKMVCLGDYDEEAYLSALRSVTNFKSENGQLQLMDGTNVLLVFKRTE